MANVVVWSKSLLLLLVLMWYLQEQNLLAYRAADWRWHFSLAPHLQILLSWKAGESVVPVSADVSKEPRFSSYKHDSDLPDN